MKVFVCLFLYLAQLHERSTNQHATTHDTLRRCTQRKDTLKFYTGGGSHLVQKHPRIELVYLLCLYCSKTSTVMKFTVIIYFATSCIVYSVGLQLILTYIMVLFMYPIVQMNIHPLTPLERETNISFPF